MAKPGPKADVEVEGPSVGVIVHTAKPYGEVTAAIEALGGSVTIEYVNADAVAAEVPFGNLGELAATSGVAYIEKDVIVEVPAPSEPMYGRHPMDADGIEILDSGAAAELIGEDPENYYSYLSGVTGAEDTWAETGAGADSLVAIIDSGTEASHPCLAGRVIEGPNFSGDGISSISPLNFFHGTFVGGVMAARIA